MIEKYNEKNLEEALNLMEKIKKEKIFTNEIMLYNYNVIYKEFKKINFSLDVLKNDFLSNKEKSIYIEKIIYFIILLYYIEKLNLIENKELETEPALYWLEPEESFYDFLVLKNFEEIMFEVFQINEKNEKLVIISKKEIENETIIKLNNIYNNLIKKEIISETQL